MSIANIKSQVEAAGGSWEDIAVEFEQDFLKILIGFDNNFSADLADSVPGLDQSAIQAEIGSTATESGSATLAAVATTGSYADLIDEPVSTTLTATGGQTENLGAIASYNGGFVFVKKTDATGFVTVVPNGAETINGQSSIQIKYQNTVLQLFADGSNWNIV